MKKCWNIMCICWTPELEINNCATEDIETEDCRLADVDLRPIIELLNCYITNNSLGGLMDNLREKVEEVRKDSIKGQVATAVFGDTVKAETETICEVSSGDPVSESPIKSKMKINSKNNFIRIFKIPHNYPKGFCFGGGKDVNFVMVDWFEPYPVMDCPEFVQYERSTKELVPLCECPNQEIELTTELREKLNATLCEFIRKKNYNEGHDLLAITNYGDSFIIENNIVEEE